MRIGPDLEAGVGGRTSIRFTDGGPNIGAGSRAGGGLTKSASLKVNKKPIRSVSLGINRRLTEGIGLGIDK